MNFLVRHSSENKYKVCFLLMAFLVQLAIEIFPDQFIFETCQNIT